MSQPTHSGPKFTLLQLLAAVTVIAFLFGVLTPLIRGARESGRRAACTNNLRQLALGVHLYHDVSNQFPPLATDEAHWSWIVLMLPYYEQFRGREEGDPTPPPPTYGDLQFHLAAADPINLPFIRVHHSPTMVCPERRPDAVRHPTAVRLDGTFRGGQPTDYVAVSTTTSLGWSDKSDGVLVFRSVPLTLTSPLRSATNFGSVTDGTANTAMIGEKHMRPQWLGGEYDEPALVAFQNPNTIRVASDLLSRGLAQRREDDDAWKFGSWHSKVDLFAMADAAVRPVKKDTDASILRLLCCRNDQTAFELP